jgi:hypothetical protein
MDPKFKTSFIPKQEVMTSGGRPVSGFRFSLIAIIATALFSISVILSVMVFFYQKSLVNQIKKMNAELVASRNSFDPKFVQDLIGLDKRIEVSKKLLDKHLVITPLFAMLESKTLKGVRFNNLDFKLNSVGTPSLDMNGEASNFSAVALQSDIFSADSVVKNPVFSSLNLDESGIVKFVFKGKLDGESLLYKNFIKSNKTEDATKDL